jgi:TRAP-type uncharacterized transport system substrate-binding protein
MTRRGWWLLACLLWCWPARAHADPPSYRFGAGSKKGGFTQIAEAIAVGLTSTGDRVRIEVQQTGGSCDNIRKLLQGELDFALVQYDIAAEAFKAGTLAEHTDAVADGSGGPTGFLCKVTPEMAANVDLRLLSALADDAIHVLVRRPVRLDAFDALRGQKVYLGKAGSGSVEISKVILGAAGLSTRDIVHFDGDNDQAMQAFGNEELLAMLRTSSPGNPETAEILGSGVASLNPLPDDVLNRLIDGYPYYRVCQIDAGAYPGLDHVVPTVCVASVVLMARPRGQGDAEDPEADAAVAAMLDAIAWVERSPAHQELAVVHRWRDFAEREPVPLHPIAADRERHEKRRRGFEVAAAIILVLGAGWALRRTLRRRGLLKDPLESNLEGQLSNPLIPFAGFVTIVLSATFLVWTLEHDSNARVRTLNDSFWEMNMFATGNFSTDSLKTSTARFIGATATIAGLGLLAWFTAALTNIFAKDQTRLFRRLRNHIVILNFREDMLQLIRMLRSPGPLRSRPIHVVVSDSLPKRVRLQLARVKGLTIYQQNPEVPEDLASLRIPRAARVIVLQSDPDDEVQYHPLRVARAVHQACSKFGAHPTAQGPELGKTGFSVAPPLQHPAIAGDDASNVPSLPVTMVEANDGDPEEIFAPFRRWLVPVPGRALADRWLATACIDPGFADVFNGVVSFRDENSEVYTCPLPEWLHGRTWRIVRRTLSVREGRAGIVPLGLYRGSDTVHAYDATAATASPERELARRLLVNPALDLVVGPGDRLVAFAEDEADLRRILRESRGHVAEG